MTMFLGAVFGVHPHHNALVPEVKISKTLKDPLLIAAARDEAIRGLSFLPMTGQLRAFSLVDPAGKIVCSMDANGFVAEKAFQPLQQLAQRPGVLLMSVLSQLHPQGLRRCEHNSTRGLQIGADLYGFNVRSALRVAAFEALQYGMTLAPSFHWWGRYQDDVAACDPYDDVLTTETIKQISRDKVFQFFGLGQSTHPTESLRLAEDARQLAVKLNLG